MSSSVRRPAALVSMLRTGASGGLRFLPWPRSPLYTFPEPDPDWTPPRSVDEATQAIQPPAQEVTLSRKNGQWHLYRPASPTLLGVAGDPSKPLSTDPDDPVILDPDGNLYGHVVDERSALPAGSVVRLSGH